MTENHVSGMEASAISVLKRAVELDQAGRFQESLVCYQEGIQLLMDVLKGLHPADVICTQADEDEDMHHNLLLLCFSWQQL